MKYKINMPDNWKQAFTVAELETIKAIKSMGELQYFCKVMEEVITGYHNTVLKIEFVWMYNRVSETFFTGNIDIICDVWYLAGFDEVRHVVATFYEINNISCEDDRKTCGFQEVFRR